MKSFEFINPVRIVFGDKTVNRTGELAASLGSTVLLVTGTDHAQRSGIGVKVRDSLIASGLKVFNLTGISPNPKLNSVQKGAEICRTQKVDLIIGLGGGSVMDTAKIISSAALYKNNPWDLLMHSQADFVPPTKALPTMMIPTLAATGSEMNAGAVITNTDESIKSFVQAPCLFPKISILDPELTLTAPPNQTAYGIVDTAVHVMESYFNNTDETPLQDEMVEGLLRTLGTYGHRAVKNGRDMVARTHLLWASTIALNGIIQAGASGPFPVHSMEHAISGRHARVSHGAGLAALQPAWMKHMLGFGKAKFVQFAQRVFGITASGIDDADAAKEGISALKLWFEELGAPTSLSQIDILPEHYPEILDSLFLVYGKDGNIPAFVPHRRDDVKRIFSLAR